MVYLNQLSWIIQWSTLRILSGLNSLGRGDVYIIQRNIHIKSNSKITKVNNNKYNIHNKLNRFYVEKCKRTISTRLAWNNLILSHVINPGPDRICWLFKNFIFRILRGICKMTLNVVCAKLCEWWLFQSCRNFLCSSDLFWRGKICEICGINLSMGNYVKLSGAH